jgi:signal transduction histidine kinase
LDKILHKISQIGLETSDDGLMINRKRFVIYEAILMSFGGILWGTICLVIGKMEQSITPFGYVVLSALNIYAFSRFKNFSFTQGFQTGISLLLPIIFQWHLGGFYASGGVMLWSLLSLAASLSYNNVRTSIYWLCVYVFLVVFSGWFDPYFQQLFPSNYDLQFSIGLVTMNISVVSVLIFLLVIFYVSENTRSLQQVKKTQELLLQSERMAALGQLSAGIAHEINTPFGAIKAISQESMELSRELLNSFYVICHKLEAKEVDQLSQFITEFSPKDSYLTTAEERAARKSLETELAQLSIDNPRILSEKMIRVGIFSIPEELKELLKKFPQELVDVLHRILLVQKNNTSILTAIEKASRVVVALKMYVHATSEGNKKHFDLLKSVETVLTIYSNQLKQGVDVRLNIPKNIDLYGYEDQIGQVWTNILVNACQAMQFRGSLTIDAEKNGDKVIVKIADSGEGISSELGDKIFEPFFSTKKIGEGSGLGLDIVRKIVEQHGGRIYYRSEISVGTTFYVELPLKSTEDAHNV